VWLCHHILLLAAVELHSHTVWAKHNCLPDISLVKSTNIFKITHSGTFAKP
jgi:hypothetical protein